jgi:hypothetical protein
MDNLIRAKIIIELLDDRKYTVLSSFTDVELEQLNAIDVSRLADLSSVDIDAVVNDFLMTVNTKVNQKNAENEAITHDTDSVEEVPDTLFSEPDPVLGISPEAIEALRNQPIQLLACVLQQLPNDRRQYVEAQLGDETHRALSTVDVVETPMSSRVARILMDQLNLV